MSGNPTQPVENTVENLRQLLLELYVGSVLWRVDLPDSEQVRLLDTVLAAGEGRPFVPLGLPFPRPETLRGAHQDGRTIDG